MFWCSFSFSVVASLMPIEVMMNLYKHIDVIERKKHSRYEKGISRWWRKIPGHCPVSFI